MALSSIRDALSQPVDVRGRLRRDVRRLLYLATWVAAAMVMVVAVRRTGPVHPIGADSHAYWLAARSPGYTTGPTVRDAYLYSPAFAEVLRPLAWLPWPVFGALFVVLDLGLLLWLLRPLGWRWVLPLAVIGLPEVQASNIHIPMAVACVLGFRYPGAWSLPLLTKVASGLGPVWFLVRREWRSLAISLGVTVAVAAVSAAVSPHLWLDWVRFLASHSAENRHPLGESPVAFVYRAPAGVALVLWGGWRGRRWTLPVGMVLCAPVLWLGTFSLLAAIPRVVRAGEGDDQLSREGLREAVSSPGERAADATEPRTPTGAWS